MTHFTSQHYFKSTPEGAPPPALSYYHAIWEGFDYNETPLAPHGAHILVHENTKQQSMWDDNCVEAWYVGPEIRGHYRCYRCYITSTWGERIYDTVQLFPRKVAISAVSSQDKATDDIHDLITTLRNPGPTIFFGMWTQGYNCCGKIG